MKARCPVVISPHPSAARSITHVAEVLDELLPDREANDAFSAESHLRAARATEEGRFDREIVPIEVTTEVGTETMSRDEGIRPDSSMETLGKLKPAFKEDGVDRKSVV